MSFKTDQFELPLGGTRPLLPAKATKRHKAQHTGGPDNLSGMDQVLSTREVERITGKHRCTIYRWVCAGTFPGKRAGAGKGWLRSDVERWLKGNGFSRET